jgi:putative oxidoreductase
MPLDHTARHDRTSLRRTMFAARVHGRPATALAVARILAGLVFMLTSIPKFPFAGAEHEHEIAEFVRFGFPHSATIVLLVGVLELVGGLMLVLGAGTRLAALGLAVNMAGAIATAGVKVGGPIHLGLAPTLLTVMLILLWTGPGPCAVDNRIARNP